MKTFKLTTIAVSVSVALLAQPAHAVLERVGPTVAANGFPAWYQDNTGLALEFCAPLTQGELNVGACLLLPGDAPAVPEVFPNLFFDEHFFFEAGAAMTTAAGAKANIGMAVEGAFASGNPVANQQIVFTRIRVLLNPVPVSGTYKFIHPYGEESLEGVAGERIFFTDDVGVAPNEFTGAMKGRLGPFLLPSAIPGGAEIAAVDGSVIGAVPGKKYIADPARLGPVTGSTLPDFLGSDNLMHNHNIYRIEGPVGSALGGPGIDYIETSDFALMGRIMTGGLPNQVVVDRASYARSSTEQKVDVFATAIPTAAGRLPGAARPAGVAPATSFYDAACGSTFDALGNFVAYTAPVGANEILMSASGNARWGQIRPAVGTAIPDVVCVKDNSAVDINGQQVPAYYPRPVNDVVRITDAVFDPIASTLTVTAVSSDQVVSPTLTLNGYNATLANGTVTVSGVTAPVSQVSVLSAARGTADYLVSTAAAPDSADLVVANGDTMTMAEDELALAARTMSLIANDTLNGNPIDPVATPVTLAILANGSKGTAVVNSATGEVTYTPNLNANGADSFSYTVTSGSTVSNIATVTVNITPVNDAPVSVADSAVGAVNSAMTINVLGNDSDLDGDLLTVAAGSVTVPVGPVGGVASASANPNGTIAFTANAAGTYRFNYQAFDGALASASSQVTVTVSAPDNVTIGTGDYTVSKNRWKVSGGTNVSTAHTMTLKLTGVVGGLPCNADGRVLASTTSTGTTYAFDFAGTGPLDPRTTNCNRIKVESSLGGVSANFTFRLK